MQKTINFGLATAIFSAQANAIAIETRSLFEAAEDGNDGQKLSCGQLAALILEKIPAQCTNDEKCLDKFIDYEVDLNGGCTDATAVKEAVKAHHASRKEEITRKEHACIG